MKRRTFVHRTCHALALPAMMGSFGFASPHRLASLLRATAETDRVLVLIYLQGGNDGLNTTVPLDQLSLLNKVRPHVALPENKLLPLSGTNLAFHPELDGFRSLYNEGRLRIIQSVGYPDQDFSHFRSTDIWMSGSDAHVNMGSGWPGRFLSNEYPDYPEGYPNATVQDPLSIEIGYGSSLLFQGMGASMGVVLNDPTSFHQLVDNIEEEAPDTYAGEKLRYIRLTARQSQLYGEVVKNAAAKVTYQQPYPQGNELAQQLKIVARLIAGGLKTAFYLVRIGGFDTHDAQVLSTDHTKGRHATLLGFLDEAVMAFTRDLRYHGVDDKVLGVTFSEFGRRIISNAGQGTDHGAAAPLFVFGNKVAKGVLGTNPIIPSNATFKDNLPLQFDFRQVYSSILEQWFGVSQEDRSLVLTRDFPTLPIIGEDLSPVVGPGLDQKQLLVHPNPFYLSATVDFLSDGKPMQIEAVDMLGRVRQIFNGEAPRGRQSLAWDATDLPCGNYHVILRGTATRSSVNVVKVK